MMCNKMGWIAKRVRSDCRRVKVVLPCVELFVYWKAVEGTVVLISKENPRILSVQSLEAHHRLTSLLRSRRSCKPRQWRFGNIDAQRAWSTNVGGWSSSHGISSQEIKSGNWARKIWGVLRHQALRSNRPCRLLFSKHQCLFLLGRRHCGFRNRWQCFCSQRSRRLNMQLRFRRWWWSIQRNRTEIWNGILVLNKTH